MLQTFKDEGYAQIFVIARQPRRVFGAHSRKMPDS